MQPSRLGTVMVNAIRSSKSLRNCTSELCAQGTKRVIHRLLSIIVHWSQVATHALTPRFCISGGPAGSIRVRELLEQECRDRRGHLVQIKIKRH